MPKGVYGSAFNSSIPTNRWASRKAILGIKKGILKPAVYNLRVSDSAEWGRRNRDKTRAANRRYQAKMRKVFGSTNIIAQQQFAALNTAKRMALRKKLIEELNAS